MTVKRADLETKLYYKGSEVLPSFKSNLSQGVISVLQVTAEFGDTDIAINNISNRGDIKELFIWTDIEQTDITIKVNGSAARKVQPVFQIGGPITNLTYSNASADTNYSLNIGYLSEVSL